MKYTLDAKDLALGRLASKAAGLLNGKSLTSFARNQVPEVTVEIVNASAMKVSGNKMNDRVHKNFSGYPGGLKETPLKRVVEKHGYAELVKHAVRGMLPKNKLQDLKMKNLIVNN